MKRAIKTTVLFAVAIIITLIPLSRSNRYGFGVSTSYNLMPFKEQGIKNLGFLECTGRRKYSAE